MSHSENFPLEEFNLQSFTDEFHACLAARFRLVSVYIVCHQHANDSSYQSYSLTPRMMPLAPCHQNFEQLQAHARDRLVRQVIADALNRVLAALDKMHLFLQLVQHKQNAMGVLPEIQKDIQAKQQQFLELRISQKFHFLKLGFDVKSPFTDFVLALELVFDALVHHRGYVQDQHLNAGYHWFYYSIESLRSQVLRVGSSKNNWFSKKARRSCWRRRICSKLLSQFRCLQITYFDQWLPTHRRASMAVSS